MTLKELVDLNRLSNKIIIKTYSNTPGVVSETLYEGTAGDCPEWITEYCELYDDVDSIYHWPEYDTIYVKHDYKRPCDDNHKNEMFDKVIKVLREVNELIQEAIKDVKDKE